jgi:hypothetical protein
VVLSTLLFGEVFKLKLGFITFYYVKRRRALWILLYYEEQKVDLWMEVVLVDLRFT